MPNRQTPISGNRNPLWFKGLLEQGKERFGSRIGLARAIGLHPSAIIGWENGSAPGIDHLDALLRVLGGDLERALPEYRPPADETIKTIGDVAAGPLTFMEAQDIIEGNFEDLWRESPWWSYTDASAPVLLLRVRGDSMAPTYPDGSLIAIRRPSTMKLPNGTPCVFRDGDELTFKLLMHTKDDGISGLPLNQDFDLVRLKKPRIEFVALGSVQPRMTISLSFFPPEPHVRTKKAA